MRHNPGRCNLGPIGLVLQSKLLHFQRQCANPQNFHELAFCYPAAGTAESKLGARRDLWKVELMITFVVVGRNDGYGINLHKRTAISLNCLAELCERESDEIIYVDCNTDDRDLTLTEAIGDTLTQRTRRYLVTYRINGELMRRALRTSEIRFSDELSRNVAIRRSNPQNQWLLSTNCDIIILPISAQSFTQIIQQLEPRFYCCARVSIPSEQWQQLNRSSPQETFALCDTIVHRGFRLPPEQPEPWLRFQSVGDFQLAPREHWFKVGGCEEAMIGRGHSDTNNSRRLSLLDKSGRTPDLLDWLRVFHLEHNYPETEHPDQKNVNDRTIWVEKVTEYRSTNAPDWGLSETHLPAIRLSPEDPTPREILATAPRGRRLVKTLFTWASARLWKRLSDLLNLVEKKISPK